MPTTSYRIRVTVFITIRIMLDGNLNFFRRRKGHFLGSKINERLFDSDRVGKEDKFRFDLKPFWSRESRDVMEPSFENHFSQR